MKLIVAGSRHIDDAEFIESILDGFKKDGKLDAIISGLARGPDTIGKEWAEKNGIPVIEFPAEWEKYKNAAGPIRNSKMLEVADALLAFWDGKSSGTKDMIKKTEKSGKSFRVIVMPNCEKFIPEIKPLDF